MAADVYGEQGNGAGEGCLLSEVGGSSSKIRIRMPDSNSELLKANEELKKKQEDGRPRCLLSVSTCKVQCSVRCSLLACSC